MRRVEPVMSFPADDPRHGTLNGYNNLGCRCERCYTAMTAYNQRPNMIAARVAYRRRQGAKPLSQHLAENEALHGTESRYNSTRYKCRCDDCKRASSEARARRRAAVV